MIEMGRIVAEVCYMQLTPNIAGWLFRGWCCCLSRFRCSTTSCRPGSVDKGSNFNPLAYFDGSM